MCDCVCESVCGFFWMCYELHIGSLGLNAASTTAGPGVSVLIITLLRVIFCITLYFVATDTHKEEN